MEKLFRKFIPLFVLLAFVTGQEISSYSEDEEKASTLIPHHLSSATVVEATMGESVKLPCQIDDLGDFVRLWKKGKASVLFASDLRILRDERFRVDDGSLRISSVQPKDSGEYVCQISSNPPTDLIHTLNVLYPPSIKSDPRDGFVTVKEGETVTLACEATGNPIPKINWKHAGRHYDITDGNRFTIANAVKSASGEYECIADNGVGDTASASITVEVVSAPKVYPKPKDGLLVVKEGDAIEISCEATGDPLPVISWKTPGVDKAQKSRDNNQIIISEAERSHAGAYECIANNSLGVFTSAIIRVSVLYSPEVRVQNSWIHAGEGTPVNMSCSAKGEPTPTVSWKRGEDKVIHPNDHYHLKSSGQHHILHIRRLREEDFGRYECVASNTLGTAVESVHVIGTPQVPSFTSKPHGSQESTYTLVWNVKSPSPIHEYSLIYREKAENQEWKTVTIQMNQDTSVLQTHMYDLTGLKAETAYEAMVTARNKFGWSKQSDSFTFMTKKAEFTDEASENVIKPESMEEVLATANSDKLPIKSENGIPSLRSWPVLALIPATIMFLAKHLH